MNLSENIYRFRTEQNLSQLDLADALEVSRQSVSKWETGAAVPELDKLIKMSDLFDVSLDVLVGRSTPSVSAPVPSTQRWVFAFPTQKIAGAILLACAFLFFLACVVKNSIFEGFLWSLPLVLCGIICFVCKRHVSLWCAWILFLPFLLIPLKQFMRADIATLVNLFTRIPLLICTVLSFRKEQLELTKPIRLFLGAGWMTWFFWLILWFGSLHNPPDLFDGFSLGYVMEVLTFPLFTALLTTTLRIQKTN